MANVNIRVQAVNEEEQTGIPSQKKDEQKGAKPTAKTLFIHYAINQAKQIVNYGISNIGNFTGDYTKQQQVQQSVDLLSDIAGIGVAFATNWVAGVIAIAGTTTKQVMGVISENQQMVHAERERQYLLERSGNSTKNGSRTGE